MPHRRSPMHRQAAKLPASNRDMRIVHSIAELRAYRAACKGRVGLVPTMGALHAGHVSLMDLARQGCDHLLVSLFVNPIQFNEASDFEHYPRTFEIDADMCRAAGVDCLFAPSVDQVYPPDEVEVAVDVPALTDDLEGRHRPGHFQGVCRVVAKLFNMVQPDIAVFGEKDYQQLAVIRAMTRGLCMPIDIQAGPTIRETDGLAMSSRNRRLDDAQRGQALGLSKALKQGVYLIEQQGEVEPEAVETAMHDIMTAYGVDVEYAVVRHPRTLAPLASIDPQLMHGQGVVLLAAGHVGEVRLIDNMIASSG